MPFVQLAANSDYFPVSAQITFPPGSGPLTSLGSELDPIDDNRVEGNENVQLNAFISAGVGLFEPNGDTATVVILDDDGKSCKKMLKIHFEVKIFIFTV